MLTFLGFGAVLILAWVLLSFLVPRLFRDILDTRGPVVVAAVLLGGLALCGCRKPEQPTTTGPSPVVININNNQQQQSGNTGTASPAPGSAQCAPVQRVGVIATATTSPDHITTFKVGQTVRLDATPQGADAPIPSNCVGATVQWSLSGAATCSLSGDQNGFTPFLTCSAPGGITACAAVAPPGGTGCGAFTVTQ